MQEYVKRNYSKLVKVAMCPFLLSQYYKRFIYSTLLFFVHLACDKSANVRRFLLQCIP